MNNDLRRWSDIKQTLLDYHNGLVMSKFLTEADCRNARFAVEGALYELELVPAVDAVEVVHGRWLDRPKNQGWKDEEIGTVGMVDGEPWSSCYCSECGEWLVASDEYSVKGNYCPNCGADMRERKE